MIPILFSPEAEPEALLEANSLILEDVNSVELWASGDTSAPRAFDTLGLGALTDCITCEVTEERNGSYELSMEYPVSGVHYDEIELRCIILARANYTDAPQAFRIYSITTPIDGKVTINARHISYDLSGVPVLPFTATSAADACQGLIDNAAIDTPFTVNTQVGTIADFTADVPASIRSWFGGKEGSLIDVYGGEWAYDNYTCTLKANRGANRGVTIRYGVNLIDFEQEKNCEATYTGVLPYWADEEGNIVRANIINLDGTFEYRRILCLDLSADFEEQPTAEQLTARAETYIRANNIGVPRVSITLDWVQIGELSDRVELCDTVKVVFEKIGVEASAKVVRVVWDVLKERYSSIEIGEPKTNITDTIAGLEQETEKATSSVSPVMLGAIQRATAAITGNSGGYIVMHDSNGDGEPDELLVMNTPDISTATKVWRWNLSGLGYSNSGYNGTFGLAMTMDGEIVADYITTGTLSADRILGGTLKLGGSGNGNGVMTVYDSSDTLAAQVNNNGVTTYDTATGYYNRLNAAKLNFYDNSGNTLGYLARELYESNYGLRLKSNSQMVVSGTTYFWIASGGGLDLKADGDGLFRVAGSLLLSSINNAYINISNDGGINLHAGNSSYIFAQRIYGATTSAAANVCVASGGALYRSTSSSRRYKEAITEDLADLDPEVLYKLPVVRFRFKDGYISEDDERYGTDVIGFIAEDVDELYPIAVRHEDGQAEMWESNYIIPAMMKLIQNQKHELDELKATVTDLTARLDRLEARFADDGR